MAVVVIGGWSGSPERSAGQDCNGNGVSDDKDLVPERYGFARFAAYPVEAGATYIESRDHMGEPVDLDGNDAMDLIVVNRTANTVSVLLNRGDGSFLPQSSYKVGESPRWAVVGDFDGDEIPDVATANFTGRSVTVLTGVGDGTLDRRIDHALGYRPAAMTGGDFNGDRVTDVAVMFWDAPHKEGLTIFLNRGNGLFDAAAAYVLETYPAIELAVGDLNGDRIRDLVCLGGRDGSHLITARLGAGDGTFDFYENHEVWRTSDPSGLEIADFDGDGDEDVAVSGVLNLFENEGEGRLRAQQLALLSVGGDVRAVDVDFDGAMEFVLAYGPFVAVARNQGGLQYLEPEFFPVGLGSRSVTTGDFDGDGLVDFASANTDFGPPALDYVAVLLGKTTGPAQSHDCNRNRVPDECDIAAGGSEDCDADGIPDECEQGCRNIRGNLVPCDRNDCNGNEVIDACDILDGVSDDVNRNEQPDECEACFGDFNRNGVREEIDARVVEAMFGCPVGAGQWPCDEADIDRDGRVGPVDLGLLRMMFGPCPSLEE